MLIKKGSKIFDLEEKDRKFVRGRIKNYWGAFGGHQLINLKKRGLSILTETNFKQGIHMID